ncbi:RluA family pseudouridine synthase [Thalassobacillus pellis]|uniref:RluA family pseudouridine synthase n=1 Tax=Thalassobacillus pellis TaxID=748008 RepID=UPI0019613BB0
MAVTNEEEWFEWRVPEEWSGQTVEKVLKTVWKIPKKLLHELRMNKDVEVNGEQVRWSLELQENDRLLIRLFQEEDYGVSLSPMDIEVLYEDSHLIVVNKPAGVDTHPNEPGQEGTLANGIAYHYQQRGLKAKVRHIHRLDRETSGAVIFAKHPLAVHLLDRELEARSIKRTYLAQVHGKLEKPSGIIDQPIGKDRHHSKRRRVSPRGQQATTEYEVLRYVASEDVSLVKLQLQTGRTHQIRVHMSYLNHPVVGDELYGSKTILPRHALHAAIIRFEHPFTGEEVFCKATARGLPAIFQEEMKKIKP